MGCRFPAQPNSPVRFRLSSLSDIGQRRKLTSEFDTAFERLSCALFVLRSLSRGFSGFGKQPIHSAESAIQSRKESA
jgi:hypothetical protein